MFVFIAVYCWLIKFVVVAHGKRVKQRVMSCHVVG